MNLDNPFIFLTLAIIYGIALWFCQLVIMWAVMKMHGWFFHDSDSSTTRK